MHSDGTCRIGFKGCQTSGNVFVARAGMENFLKVKVFKGLAATTELLDLKVERNSVVFDLMVTIKKD